MKIGVCALGPDLNSQVSPVFGRAPYFLILNLENDEFEVIPNPAFGNPKGAGVGASQILVSQGVKVVICGNFGPNAFSVLKMSGIKIYPGVMGLTIEEAVKSYKEGRLKQAEIPSAPGHFGFGREKKFGEGFGGGSKRHRRSRRGG